MKWWCVLALLPMIYSDFRERRIKVLHLGLFAAIWIVGSVWSVGIRSMLWQMLPNVLLLALCGGVLTVYLRLRKGRWCRGEEYIGKGDLLFVLILSSGFEFREFLRFLIVGCLFSLVVWRILFWGKKGEVTIPFVGTLGICCAIYLFFLK